MSSTQLSGKWKVVAGGLLNSCFLAAKDGWVGGWVGRWDFTHRKKCYDAIFYISFVQHLNI